MTCRADSQLVYDMWEADGTKGLCITAICTAGIRAGPSTYRPLDR